MTRKLLHAFKGIIGYKSKYYATLAEKIQFEKFDMLVFRERLVFNSNG